MARALIIGGGAIGRGFIPWVLDNFTIDIFDTCRNLVTGISSQKGYHSFMSNGEILNQKWVQIQFISDNFDTFLKKNYDIVFVSVGPRNVSNLPDKIKHLECPIFSLENDPVSVETMKDKFQINNIYFGVPDVITSSTAAPENLALDPFSIHTENGILYLQRPSNLNTNLESLLPDVHWLPLDRLNEEWDAKLYIHNTPHCIAAYLGHMAGLTYLHEAMARPSIKKIVYGVVDELLCALKNSTPHDHNFIEKYAIKEVKRFSNKLLFDPVSRVAREPIRKLQPTGRLLGALRLLLSSGVNPTFLMSGIAAALCYSDKNDKDYLQLAELKEFGIEAFLKYHLKIDKKYVETEYISKNFNPSVEFLKREIK